MAEQRELFDTATETGATVAPARPVALIVEDAGGTVRFTVEGQPAPKYGPHKGRKPRGVS